MIGGTIGLASAFGVLRLASLWPRIPLLSVHLNWRILLAAFVLSTIFGLLSGVWPAWKMARQHPVTALEGGAS